MIQSYERKPLLAELGVGFKLRVSVVLEGLETQVTILAVDRYWEIQRAGELPKRIVLGIVQPFPFWQDGIAHGYGAELLHGAARLFDHLADIASRQDGNELQPFCIRAAVLVTPVVVSPAHRRAKLDIFQRDAIGEVTIVRRRQAHLNIPAVFV